MAQVELLLPLTVAVGCNVFSTPLMLSVVCRPVSLASPQGLSAPSQPPPHPMNENLCGYKIPVIRMHLKAQEACLTLYQLMG